MTKIKMSSLACQRSPCVIVGWVQAAVFGMKGFWGRCLGPRSPRLALLGGLSASLVGYREGEHRHLPFLSPQAPSFCFLLTSTFSSLPGSSFYSREIPFLTYFAQYTWSLFASLLVLSFKVTFVDPRILGKKKITPKHLRTIRVLP